MAEQRPRSNEGERRADATRRANGGVARRVPRAHGCCRGAAERPSRSTMSALPVFTVLRPERTLSTPAATRAARATANADSHDAAAPGGRDTRTQEERRCFCCCRSLTSPRRRPVVRSRPQHRWHTGNNHATCGGSAFSSLDATWHAARRVHCAAATRERPSRSCHFHH